MNSKVLKSLLLAAGFSAVSLVMGSEADVERSIQLTVDTYSVDRQKQESAAADYVNKGNQLFIDGKYQDAADNYNKAVRVYETLKANSPHFQDKQTKTKELISRAYFYLAQETVQRAEEEANASEFDKAIELCKKAIKIYPAAAKEMNQRIETYTKMKNAANRRSILSEEQVIKDLSKNKYDVAVLLKKAKLLYRDGRYDDARKYYQEVLLKDRFCAEAIQGLRATNLKITKAGEDRFRLTHKRAVAETSWKSVTPIVNSKAQDVRADIKAQDAGGVPVVVDETAPLRAKLKKIVIPPVNFGDRLPVVLKWLRQRSIENDPDREGVNIFLYFPDTKAEGEGGAAGGAANRQQAGLGAEAEGDEGGDEDEDEESEDAEAGESRGEDMSKYPVVNLNLANKTLLEVIEALAQAAKLKYKIEKNAVIFAPIDAPLDDMQIKVFLFDQNMVEQFGGSESPDDLKSNFVTNGVPFPTGSKVMYDAKFRALIALNTPENLELLNKTILEARKREPEPVVQIQVKFVEVEQNDLKELGFIQTLGRPNGATGNKTNGRLQFDRNDVTLYDSGRTLFSYSRSNKGYDYNLAINAVNQLDSKDVLSSPKVLTNPGKKVSIKMTSERYFQWDYEEGEYENNNSDGASGYTYTPPWPEFEMQELGITFETTPTVDKTKRLITMPIAPWVRSLVGWTAYTYYVSSENAGGGAREEVMKRPIIAERTTDTIITLYDNETVVIGGIIKDYTVLVDDKIPFLGDIPLLGKLFTSQSSQIKKTNLLIFVTARLLKPDGSPYYQYDSRGRPNSIGLGDIY